MCPGLLFALSLGIYVSALVFEAWHLGLTADEPSHWMAGYMYWLGDDTLYPSDAPPLTRIVAGWVPRALGVPLYRDLPMWADRNAYAIGSAVLGSADAGSAHRYIFLSRLPFLVFPILLVLAGWLWARDLFGDVVAFIVAVCLCAEPTIGGHAALMTSDVPAAAMAMLAAWLGWRYWTRPGVGRILAFIAAVIAATLTKFSLLVLLPLAVIVIAIRGPRILGLTVLIAGFYLSLLAAYQFHATPLSTPEVNELLHFAFDQPPRKLAHHLGKLPWPPQFIRGLKFIGAADRFVGFSAYMLGHRVEGAQPWYFPLAWAVKFPIAMQLLALAGLLALALRIVRRQAGPADAFVWIPAAVVAEAAIRSHIHIGFRHFLPVLPFLVLGGGFAIHRWWNHRAGRAVSFGLSTWALAAAVFIYPQGISYFNEWIGGPLNGRRYLADSNVDWSQNLPELAHYVDVHRVPKVKLFYFGLDAPSHYMPPGRFEEMPAPYQASMVKETRLVPAPGTYAISVNMLLGYGFAEGYSDYLGYFKSRNPVGRAGYSILIYEAP